MNSTLSLILNNHLILNCIKEYKLDDVVKARFGDVKLKKNQVALIYEVYYEYKGQCTISTSDKILLKADMISCNKTSYMDTADQVKVFELSVSTIVKESFTFAGTGMNPHIKYLLITKLD